MMSRVLISLQAAKILVIASVAMCITNVISDYALKQVLGIDGIALATVVNQALSLTFLVFVWRRLQHTRMSAA